MTEKNPRIEKTSNSYVVKSDSERFGNDEITFESKSYKECLDYIANHSEITEPKYYVIKDLSENIPDNIKYFDSCEEAIAEFNNLSKQDYMNEVKLKPWDDEPYVRLTLGVSKDDMWDMDLVHSTSKDNIYLISDALEPRDGGFKDVMVNKHFIKDLNKITKNLDIKFYKSYLGYDENGVKESIFTFKNRMPYWEDVNKLADKIIEGTGFGWDKGEIADELLQGEMIDPIIQSIHSSVENLTQLVEETDFDDPARDFFTEQLNILERLEDTVCDYLHDFEKDYTDTELLNDLTEVFYDYGVDSKEQLLKEYKEKLDDKKYDSIIKNLEFCEKDIDRTHIKSCFVYNQLINRKEALEVEKPSFTKDSLKADLVKKKENEKDRPSSHSKNIEQSI